VSTLTSTSPRSYRCAASPSTSTPAAVWASACSGRTASGARASTSWSRSTSCPPPLLVRLGDNSLRPRLAKGRIPPSTRRSRAGAPDPRLSVPDELTGLYTSRFLPTRLSEEFKRAERFHEPFACLLVDIDQLRAVNDLGGRGAGDAAIRRVAE